MPSARAKCFVLALFVCGVSAMTLGGCSETAEEDRSVTWDASGEEVGFQHAGEGVFVASPEGGGLQRIFQPGDDVIATSPPLWAPGDKRLIFTTARYVPSETAEGSGAQDDADIEYTCWLRDAPQDGESPVPRELFTVACGDADYVRVNLAVRWHPRGEAICYVKQLASGRHALFEFDLKTGESRRAAPLEARSLLFDWAPDGSHLACVVSDGQIDAAAVPSGIWLGGPQQDNWRHVAQSEPRRDQQLAQLRSLRPTWTADGLHFAFVLREMVEHDKQPIVRSRVFAGERTTGDARMLLEDDSSLDEIRWHPSGSRLALVRNGEGEPPALPRSADFEVAGVFDIVDDFEAGRPEVQIEMHDSARALGLTTEFLATQVRSAFYGFEAKKIQRGSEDVRIMVRYPPKHRQRIYDIESMWIATPTGELVPFGEVARITEGRGYSSIKRTNQRRTVTVTAD
ncbi:MAG: efflux RND transporter permease subunit, partial [Planctomycetes bacterium]|nr:efflux RND transporter permease subunit [Planctomycetota bacterium]